MVDEQESVLRLDGDEFLEHLAGLANAVAELTISVTQMDARLQELERKNAKASKGFKHD